MLVTSVTTVPLTPLIEIAGFCGMAVVLYNVRQLNARSWNTHNAAVVKHFVSLPVAYEFKSKGREGGKFS